MYHLIIHWRMLQTYFHNQTTYIDRYYGDTLHVCTRESLSLQIFLRIWIDFYVEISQKNKKNFLLTITITYGTRILLNYLDKINANNNLLF